MIIEDESNKVILPIISAKNVVIGYDSKKPLFELEDFSVYPGAVSYTHLTLPTTWWV